MPNDCYNKIRYTLSDESGELKFRTFEMPADHHCGVFVDKLKPYLLGRPLSEIETDVIETLSCGRDGECARTIAAVVREHQEIFLDKEPPGKEPEDAA